VDWRLLGDAKVKRPLDMRELSGIVRTLRGIFWQGRNQAMPTRDTTISLAIASDNGSPNMTRATTPA
jgi:hypothetical protein